MINHSIRLANIQFDENQNRIDPDARLPYYSHSIMEAIQTCPKWGIIRYKHRKYYQSTFRAMALEAGSQMHEVFAACRLWQLLRLQDKPDHFAYHGTRLFGKTRLDACYLKQKQDKRDDLLSFCFEILNSGEFYDDPDDKIRTMANMEETTIRYCDEQLAVMNKNDIWIADADDPTAPVGIEISFDMVIDEAIRYIGTIDGIVYNKTNNRIQIEENKTASRLDDAFRNSFNVKHQPTGYMIPASIITKQNINHSKILGVKIKQTRSHEDYLSFIIHRDDKNFKQFFNSLAYTHNLVEQYNNDPLNAPMFTHSCNRYFRTCGFIDLCGADEEDEQDIFDSMEQTPLSPSEKAVLGNTNDN